MAQPSSGSASKREPFSWPTPARVPPSRSAWARPTFVTMATSGIAMAANVCDFAGQIGAHFEDDEADGAARGKKRVAGTPMRLLRFPAVAWVSPTSLRRADRSDLVVVFPALPVMARTRPVAPGCACDRRAPEEKVLAREGAPGDEGVVDLDDIGGGSRRRMATRWTRRARRRARSRRHSRRRRRTRGRRSSRRGGRRRCRPGLPRGYPS